MVVGRWRPGELNLELCSGANDCTLVAFGNTEAAYAAPLFRCRREDAVAPRSHVTPKRLDDARAILRLVYDQFTDGFATVDLRAARTMLGI